MEIMTQHKFDSIQALAAAAATRPHNAARRAGDSSQKDYSLDEYGGLTFDAAVSMAAEGGYWPEGTAHMAEVALSEPDHGQQQQRRRPATAYCGSRPNVPRYLAGAPRHMTRNAPRPHDRRVIRLAVAVGRAWSVTPEQVTNRGAAILSAVHELESQGHSVEVTAIWRNSDGGRAVSIETLIKPAGAFFSPADCAFALCHVAFQRRLCWAVAEQDKKATFLTSGGYGGGAGVNYDDFDLFLPFTTTHQRHDTPAESRETVTAMLTEQLNKQRSEAA